jgi:TM2 domain-containing membrane protein YozV
MPAKEQTQARPAAAGIPVALSAWLVPGLGHLMLGRTRRAVTFFAIVLAMFALGLCTSGASSSR